MTVETPDRDPQRAAEIAAKLQSDAFAMRARVAEAVANGASEQEVIDSLKDAYVRDLTELSREEPDTFAQVVADLIMPRAMAAEQTEEAEPDGD